MDDELLGRQSALQEAEALFLMIGEEKTVEELRELIAVPPKVERVLQAFAKANPHKAHWIESSLMFRKAVLDEFERLVREGVGEPAPERPGIEETGPEPFAASPGFTLA